MLDREAMHRLVSTLNRNAHFQAVIPKADVPRKKIAGMEIIVVDRVVEICASH